MPADREESTSPGTPIRRHTFATTHWNVVLATRDTDPQRAQQALGKLCAAYWYPVYAYVRRVGKAHEEAEDITQGFFARLLARQIFQQLDPAKGRVRSFLVVALKQYLLTVHEHEHRQKRAGDRLHVSLDGLSARDRYRYEPIEPATPEQLFERRWALALIDNALQRLRTETSAAGHERLYEELKGAIQGDKAARPYATIGQTLGISPGAVAVAVCRLRRRFAELCLEEVAHTVVEPAEVEDELNHLLQVLGR
jgi:RNA polymerase sigma factor (sigma-70 family)